MTSLAEKHCVPCQGGTAPLAGDMLHDLAGQVRQWQVVEGTRLRRSFKFPDFAAALAFVNAVGHLAEEQGHHPQMLLGWGKVVVELWTHKIGGLSESDFILAAKIDRLGGP